MQCLAILVYIYWCLNLQLPLPNPQVMWNLYFEGWRKLRIEHVRLFATVLCEGGHASILALKVQHLVPCEVRYPELWWILLVGNNVPSTAQGLVKIFPYLYVIRCDGRGGTCLCRLGMGICMELWMLGFPCWFHLLASSVILFHYRIDRGSLSSWVLTKVFCLFSLCNMWVDHS